jgi:phosphoglycolate phosphatase-like HAD superfamily hydrolase
MENREHYIAKLQIDEDDLDRCLVDQPGLFFQAAEAVAMANSHRDKLALRLKELVATVDQEIRETAEAHKEKTREDGIKHQITLDPEVKQLAREHLEACAQAEKAQALKESYQQRSYALKDLVAKQLGELYTLGVERGSVSARNRVAERIEARLAEQHKAEERGRRR